LRIPESLARYTVFVAPRPENGRINLRNRLILLDATPARHLSYAVVTSLQADIPSTKKPDTV
ncbi:MAG: hypothetical protein ACPGXK_02965, partial [Phycisphaerae bacterium]